MLVTNLVAVFETTQPQPNVNDVTSQTAETVHVPIAHSSLFSN